MTPATTESPALGAAAPERARIRLRHVAPAGSPIRPADLARWTGRLFSGGDALAELRAFVRETTGVRHCFPISTGRAGMTVLLEALHRLAPDRDEVLMPAYTCYSVAASAVKAGLRPRLVDIDATTLDMSASGLHAVDGRRVLALIATNLYGIPNDLAAHQRAATRMGAFLIDDAAQAMGATTGGRASGTWGDAGLYSLDKGKNISAIDGGLLVTNSDAVAGELERAMQSLVEPALSAVAADALKVLAYSVLLPPSVYWIPKSIPQLGLGQTPFTTGYPLQRMPALLAKLALTMLPRLANYNAQRRAHAQTLIEGIAAIEGVRVPVALPGSTPVYLRLPLLLADASRQQRLIDALNGQGVGASGSYPTSLADVPELQPHLANPAEEMPGARAVAASIVTVPTHPYVAQRDLDAIVHTLRATLTTASAA